jgi:hypothetical protein
LPSAEQAWLFDGEAQVLPIALPPRDLWQEGSVVAVV